MPCPVVVQVSALQKTIDWDDVFDDEPISLTASQCQSAMDETYDGDTSEKYIDTDVPIQWPPQFAEGFVATQDMLSTDDMDLCDRTPRHMMLGNDIESDASPHFLYLRNSFEAPQRDVRQVEFLDVHSNEATR